MRRSHTVKVRGSETQKFQWWVTAVFKAVFGILSLVLPSQQCRFVSFWATKQILGASLITPSSQPLTPQWQYGTKSAAETYLGTLSLHDTTLEFRGP